MHPRKSGRPTPRSWQGLRGGFWGTPGVSGWGRYLDEVKVLQHHVLFASRQRHAEPQQGGKHCALHVQRVGGWGWLPQIAGATAPGPGLIFFPVGAQSRHGLASLSRPAARGTPAGSHPRPPGPRGTAHRAAGHLLISYHIGDHPAGPAAGYPGPSDCASCGQGAVPGCRGTGQHRKGMTHVGTVALGKLSGRAHCECLWVRGRQVGTVTAPGPSGCQNAPGGEPSASVSAITTHVVSTGPCSMAPRSPRGPGHADDMVTCTQGPAGWVGTGSLFSRARRRTWAPTPC